MQRVPPKNYEHWKGWWLEDVADIADGVCVLSGCYGGFADGGYLIFSHFGDMIRYALVHYIAYYLDRLESKPVKAPFEEELYARLLVAEPALDDLLGEFMERGYHRGMEERLREFVNNARTGLEMGAIWVLPRDLDDLVQSTHLLIDYDAYESEEEAEANAPVFDLNNPEHCKALQARLFDLSY